MTCSGIDIAFIFNGISFSKKEEKFIEKKFRKIQLKKREVLIKTNQHVLHQYYVESGCLRAYYIDNLGKEHTIQFAVKDWWISDFTALFTSSLSIMTIEVIQDSVLFEISKKEMETLFETFPKLESYFRKKLEIAYASFQKRILANLSESAQDRYISFINTYPNIERCVKNYHIASYLGITSESLSRIRKKLSNT